MPQYEVPGTIQGKPTPPRDRLELLLTIRRTYPMRLRSDLMRVESEINWCHRYLPDGQPLQGDEEAAELLCKLIAVKEKSVAALEGKLTD